MKNIQELILNYIFLNYEKEGVNYQNLLKSFNKVSFHEIDKAVDNLKRQEILFEPTRNFLRLQPWVIKRIN